MYDFVVASAILTLCSAAPSFELSIFAKCAHNQVSLRELPRDVFVFLMSVIFLLNYLKGGENVRHRNVLRLQSHAKLFSCVVQCDKRAA